MADAETQQYAIQAWKSLDENQKAGIRFGLFPAEVMAEAKKEGYEQKDFAVALMNCAEKTGGMIS